MILQWLLLQFLLVTSSIVDTCIQNKKYECHYLLTCIFLYSLKNVICTVHELQISQQHSISLKGYKIVENRFKLQLEIIFQLMYLYQHLLKITLSAL